MKVSYHNFNKFIGGMCVNYKWKSILFNFNLTPLAYSKS